MWVGLLAVLVVGTSMAVPASSFAAATIDRGATVTVAGDASETVLVGLDTPASVSKNHRSRLVTVTNRHGRPATVEVTGPADATLYADGAANGSNVATVTGVAPGEAVVVEITLPNGYQAERVGYDVKLSGGGLVGAVTRSVAVTAGNGGGNGNGNGNGGGGGGNGNGNGAGSDRFCREKPNHRSCSNDST